MKAIKKPATWLLKLRVF